MTDLDLIELALHPNEASGLHAVTHQRLLDQRGWDCAFWVVLDETSVDHCVGLIGHRSGEPLPSGWDVERLRPRLTGDSGRTEDAEAIDYHDGWVYVFGSHFGKKVGPLAPRRGFVARFREEDVARGRGRPEMAVSRRSFMLHRLINDALRSCGVELIDLPPRSLAAFITATRTRGADQHKAWEGLVHDDDLPLNIEGAAFRPDGSVVLGLRFPVAANGHALLVDVDGVDQLFTDPNALPKVRGIWIVDAVGRDGQMAGVRDLLLVGDELHLVTGNIDARERGSLLLEDYPGGRFTVSTHWRVTLPNGARGGHVRADLVREFETLPRIEGLALGCEGRFFYVSDEDSGVHVHHTRLAIR